jgi:TetR/AcrR family transcriptional repressor of mexJK operon
MLALTDSSPDAASASAKPDRKEGQILAAARDAFLAHGYAGTSMDMVVGLARVSKATLYSRFPSKESLFAATMSAECERRGMRFAPGEFAHLPVDEALRQIGGRFMALVQSPEAVRLMQIVTGEAVRFPELGRVFFESGPARARAAVAAYLSEASARGVLALEDPEFTAGQFLMACKGMACLRTELGIAPALTPKEREGHLAKVVRLFLDGARPR